MSTTTKLILPLNETTIDPKYLTPDYGFVNAYTDDINRPYLDKHIFLLFELNLDTTKKIERACELIKNNIIPTTKKINGKMYSCYTIQITEYEALLYKKRGYPNFSDRCLIKMANFWKGAEEDVNNYVFNRSVGICNYTSNSISEEDLPYTPEEHQGLVINKNSVEYK